MVLEFIKNCPPYVLGDIAGINDKLAKKLIDSKYAIEYKEKKQEIENNVSDSTENKKDEKQSEQTEIDIPEDKEENETSKQNKKPKK